MENASSRPSWNSISSDSVASALDHRHPVRKPPIDVKPWRARAADVAQCLSKRESKPGEAKPCLPSPTGPDATASHPDLCAWLPASHRPFECLYHADKHMPAETLHLKAIHASASIEAIKVRPQFEGPSPLPLHKRWHRCLPRGIGVIVRIERLVNHPP